MHQSRLDVADDVVPTERIPELRTLTLPFSEVCMHMGVAGTTMCGEQVRAGGMVQLYTLDGQRFSGPITAGEAGWGTIGCDHTVTTWDGDGRWHRKPTSDADHAVLHAGFLQAFDALRAAGLEHDVDHPVAAQYRAASNAVNHANRSRDWYIATGTPLP